jgi:hypothetical protein
MEEKIIKNPGAVKGSQAVEEIPAENRWTIATQGLTGAYVATVKAMPLGDPFCEIVHELQK